MFVSTKSIGFIWLGAIGWFTVISMSFVSAQGIRVAPHNVQRIEGPLEKEMTAVAFSPDGKTLASVSTDKTVKLWNVATGKKLATLPEHQGLVDSVAFTPDGKALVLGSGAKVIEIWSVANASAIANLEGHTGNVRGLAFSPNGRILATAGDRTIRLWDVATWQAITTLEGHGMGARAIAFRPDGKVLASGGADGTARLWEAPEWKPRATIEMAKEGGKNKVLSLAFSPDLRKLAVVESSPTKSGKQREQLHAIQCWDVTFRPHPEKLARFEGAFTTVGFSLDGTLISGGLDKTIKFLDAASGKTTNIIHLPGAVNALALSPNGNTLAAAGNNGMFSANGPGGLITLWDLTPNP
jgi:WD40 repeat protein